MIGDHYTNHMLPNDGEFFIKNGIVHTVMESEAVDSGYDEFHQWTIWTEPVD